MTHTNGFCYPLFLIDIPSRWNGEQLSEEIDSVLEDEPFQTIRLLPGCAAEISFSSHSQRKLAAEKLKRSFKVSFVIPQTIPEQFSTLKQSREISFTKEINPDIFLREHQQKPFKENYESITRVVDNTQKAKTDLRQRNPTSTHTRGAEGNARPDDNQGPVHVAKPTAGQDRQRNRNKAALQNDSLDQEFNAKASLPPRRRVIVILCHFVSRDEFFLIRKDAIPLTRSLKSRNQVSKRLASLDLLKPSFKGFLQLPKSDEIERVEVLERRTGGEKARLIKMRFLDTGRVTEVRDPTLFKMQQHHRRLKPLAIQVRLDSEDKIDDSMLKELAESRVECEVELLSDDTETKVVKLFVPKRMSGAQRNPNGAGHRNTQMSPPKVHCQNVRQGDVIRRPLQISPVKKASGDRPSTTSPKTLSGSPQASGPEDKLNVSEGKSPTQVKSSGISHQENVTSDSFDKNQPYDTAMDEDDKGHFLADGFVPVTLLKVVSPDRIYLRCNDESKKTFCCELFGLFPKGNDWLDIDAGDVLVMLKSMSDQLQAKVMWRRRDLSSVVLVSGENQQNVGECLLEMFADLGTEIGYSPDGYVGPVMKSVPLQGKLTNIEATEILGTVFVQVATFEKDLTEMESLIATLGPLIPETNFTGGRTVLASYEGSVYRAEIMEDQGEKNEVKLLFFDYGNTEVQPYDTVFKYCDWRLNRYPRFAVPIILDGLPVQEKFNDAEMLQKAILCWRGKQFMFEPGVGSALKLSTEDDKDFNVTYKRTVLGRDGILWSDLPSDTWAVGEKRDVCVLHKDLKSREFYVGNKVEIQEAARFLLRDVRSHLHEQPLKKDGIQVGEIVLMKIGGIFDRGKILEERKNDRGHFFECLRIDIGDSTTVPAQDVFKCPPEKEKLWRWPPLAKRCVSAMHFDGLELMKPLKLTLAMAREDGLHYVQKV